MSGVADNCAAHEWGDQAEKTRVTGACAGFFFPLGPFLLFEQLIKTQHNHRYNWIVVAVDLAESVLSNGNISTRQLGQLTKSHEG